MFRIMSFNVLCYGREPHFWTLRAPLVCRLIRETLPDSFGVQEAHIDWINALTEGLPEYDYVGVGRNDGKEDGEFAAVFYLKDKFTASDSGSFWLSETPDKPSLGWDGACIRIATYVRPTEKATGREYVHFNTHLDHVGREAQVNGAKMISKKAADFGGLPVVCTGDFNVEQGSDCYMTMISGNMGDARTMAPDSDRCYTFHYFEPDKYHTTIDFIFVDKATVKPVKFRVLNKTFGSEYYSDHYAIYADVELK